MDAVVMEVADSRRCRPGEVQEFKSRVEKCVSARLRQRGRRLVLLK